MVRYSTLRRALPFTLASLVLGVACADSELGGDPLDPVADGGTVDSSTRPDAKPPVDKPDAGKPDAGVEPVGCGNGTVDPGESCDDGNLQAGDGCSPTCALETAGPRDMCQGEEIVLTAGEGSTTSFTGTVTGETLSMFNQYQASCGGGSSPDAVFRFVPPALGRATVRVRGEYAVLVSARSQCDSEATELACAGSAGQTAPEEGVEVGFAVVAQQPVYLFVDGVGGTAGTFLLDVEVDTAVCGNGIGEQPEACDDGNDVAGDGCSATCEIEDAASPAACPGMGFRLSAAAGAPGHLGFSGDTLNPSVTSGNVTASGCPANSGSHRVYAITPTVDGNLALDLLAGFEGALLHVHRSCIAGGDLATCLGAEQPLTPVRTDLAVRAEETIYAIVDSAASSVGGLFALQATLTVGTCGDGSRDGSEQCDDGNLVDGDGCSATCALEVDSASQACPGRAVSLTGAGAEPRVLNVSGSTLPVAGVPASKFSVSSCGSAAPDVVYAVSSDIDGYLTATVDADFPASLMIKSACTTGSGSADRIVCTHERTGVAPKIIGVPIRAGVPLYLMVDGYATASVGTFQMQLEVVAPVCGNGRIDGGETCDDGNLDDADGCSASCQTEPDPPWGSCENAPTLAFADEGGRMIARAASGNSNLDHTRRNPASSSSSTLTCVSAGADAWYRVTAPANGSLVARIPRATFNSVIGVRTSCLPDVNAVDQLGCDATEQQGGQQIVVPVEAGQSYVVVVDARALTQRGLYELELEFLPAGCGDTILTVNEQCDDGNSIDGDGCSSTCEIQPLAGIDTCPGFEVSLTGQGDAVRGASITVDTATLGAQTGGTCGGSGKEGAIRVRSDIGGILDVRASRYLSSFTPVIYVRDSCSDPGSEFKCAQGSAPRLSMPIVANHDYFVFIDGLAGQSGVGQVDITVTP